MWNPFRKEQYPELEVEKTRLRMTDEQQLRQLASEPVQYGEIPIDSAAKADLVRWQQNLNPELKRMAMRLKMYQQNEEGRWVPFLINGKVARPLCSDECIQELVAILEPYVSRNLMMSKLSEDFIRHKLRNLSTNVFLLTLHNRKRFHIRISDLASILDIFQGSAEPTFYRALNANEKQYLGTTSKYIHATQEGTHEVKPNRLFKL